MNHEINEALRQEQTIENLQNQPSFEEDLEQFTSWKPWFGIKKKVNTGKW